MEKIKFVHQLKNNTTCLFKLVILKKIPQKYSRYGRFLLNILTKPLRA